MIKGRLTVKNVREIKEFARSKHINVGDLFDLFKDVGVDTHLPRRDVVGDRFHNTQHVHPETGKLYRYIVMVRPSSGELALFNVDKRQFSSLDIDSDIVAWEWPT